MAFDFDKTRREALEDRQKLVERQRQIGEEKARLETEFQSNQVTIISLDQILEGVSWMDEGGPPPDFEELGFREKIEKILMDISPAYIFPTEIRERLLGMGVTATSPKNLLISVHTVIGRLDKDKLIESQEINARTAYRWKSKADIAGPGLMNRSRRFRRGVPLNSLLRPEIDPDIVEESMKVFWGDSALLNKEPEESLPDQMVRIARQRREEPKKK